MWGSQLHKPNLLLVPASRKVHNMYDILLPSPLPLRHLVFGAWKSVPIFSPSFFPNLVTTILQGLILAISLRTLKNSKWQLYFHCSLADITRCILISNKLESEKNMWFYWLNILHAYKFHIYFSSSNFSPELQAQLQTAYT